jgi:hypothetical protein
LALASPTSSGRSVGIVRSRTKATELVNDVENLQIDLNRLGEWAFENEIINPTKSKAICFTNARVTESLIYSLRDTVIPEVSSCKYLGIILRSDLSWADHVNYKVKKAWKAFHFTMCILKRETVLPKV